MQDLFHHIAKRVSEMIGTPQAFIFAVVVVAVWAATGPLFHYSDTWQLVINTGTTIVTFFVVFLIQNTQNRDAEAVHIKLDELLRAIEGARTELVDLEDLPTKEIDGLRQEFHKLHARLAEHESKHG